MWLAQQHQGIDSQLIYLLVFVVITVLTTIFGKKKNPDEKSPRGRATGAGRSPMDRPPASARPSEPPRRVELPRQTGSSAEQPESVMFPDPFERPDVVESPAPRRMPAPSRPPWPQARPRPARSMSPEYLAAAAEPVAVEIVAEPAAPVAEMPKKRKPAAWASFDPTGLQRRLRSPADLRTAFILSEILAPPVGLRDNQHSV